MLNAIITKLIGMQRIKVKWSATVMIINVKVEHCWLVVIEKKLRHDILRKHMLPLNKKIIWYKFGKCSQYKSDLSLVMITVKLYYFRSILYYKIQLFTFENEETDSEQF